MPSNLLSPFGLIRSAILAMLILVNLYLSSGVDAQLKSIYGETLGKKFTSFEHQERSDNAVSMKVVKKEAICLLDCEWSDTCVGATIKEINQTEQMICHLYDTSVDRKERKLLKAEKSRYVEAQPLQSCEDLSNNNRKSGVYKLETKHSHVFRAACDMETDNGGWTLVQLRQDGSVAFNRTWEEYKHGFGDPEGEHWLGLDKMHQLTLSGDVTMRFDLWADSEHVYAEYKNTTISDESEDYLLDFQSYEGNATDAMTEKSKGIPFSTWDHDVDTWNQGNCADDKKGGGWHSHCIKQNMNGIYKPGVTDEPNGIYWQQYKGRYYSMSRFEVKFKRNG